MNPAFRWLPVRRCHKNPQMVLVLSNNRLELFKFRNQLHATRGRVESYRIVLVDSPLDSPAYSLQLSVSAAS